MAGAIIAGGQGTAVEKMEKLRAAGAHVCESPAELGSTMQKALSKVKKSVAVRHGKSAPRAKAKAPAKASPRKKVK